MPVVNFKCLRAIVIHLNLVAIYEEQNKMGVTNLTTVWAPVLMGAEFGAMTGSDEAGSDGCFDPRVVDDFINNCVDIFEVSLVNISFKRCKFLLAIL